jgi:hypothetical protein
MKKIISFLVSIPLFFLFTFNVHAWGMSNIPNDYSTTLDTTTYNFFKDKCSSLNSCVVLRGNYYGTNDMYLIFDTPSVTINSYSITFAGNYSQYHVADLTFNNSTNNSKFVGMSNSFLIFYAKNINVSSAGSDLTYANIGSTISSSFDNVPKMYFAGSTTQPLRGLYNIVYEPLKSPTTYTINYYFDDVLDSDKTISSNGFVGDSLNITNMSTDYFSIDNNNYTVTLKEDSSLNVFNIYYYDKYFGTDYEQIDTTNSELYLPFSMSYLKSTFRLIDFTKFTMFQQFVICIGVNIFFIVFLFFFLRLLRMAMSYLMRLF